MRIRSLALSTLLVFSGAGCGILLGLGDYKDAPAGTGGATTSSTTSASTTQASASASTTASTSTTTSASASSSGGGTGGAGGMGGTGGAGGSQCKSPADCPQPSAKDVCHVAACTAGVCSLDPVLKDTTAPPTFQVTGDCKDVVCDGNGGLTNKNNDLDLPTDNNDCTVDSCNMGGSVFMNSGVLTKCKSNNGKVCDGAGTCVECVDNSTCMGTDFCHLNQCVSATCNDLMQNGTETDIDCGGGSCSPCITFKKCSMGTDCVDKVCTSGACALPTCTDGFQNGIETDKDCGGSCQPCGPNLGCKQNSDCKGNNCSGGICLPSCTDVVLNNGESDIDCGGPNCAKCPFGKQCFSGSDCTTGACVNGGVCGCPQNMSLVNGTCSCNAGFIDCDGSLANGCETPVVLLAPDSQLTTGLPGLGNAGRPSIAWTQPGVGTYGVFWQDGTAAAPFMYFAGISAPGVVTVSATKVSTAAMQPLPNVGSGAISWVGGALQNFYVVFPAAVGGAPTLQFEKLNTGAGVVGGPTQLANASGLQAPAIATMSPSNYEIAYLQANPTNQILATNSGAAPTALFMNNPLEAPDLATNGTNYALALVDASGSVGVEMFAMDGTIKAYTPLTPANGVMRAHPAITFFNNTFGVVWEEMVAGNPQIFFAATDPNGVLTVVPTKISSTNATSARHASIAGGDGGFRVVFAADETGFSPAQIFYVRIKTDGTKTGIDYPVTNIAMGQRSQPDIAWDGAAYGVVYGDTRAGTRDLYYQHLPACAP